MSCCFVVYIIHCMIALYEKQAYGANSLCVHGARLYMGQDFVVSCHTLPCADYS